LDWKDPRERIMVGTRNRGEEEDKVRGMSQLGANMGIQ